MPRRRPRSAHYALEVLEDRNVLSSTSIVDPEYLAWRQQQFTLDAVDTQVYNQVDHALQGDVTSLDAQSSQLIGLNQVRQQFPSYTGAGYSVAVIDTGINYNHPALGGGWGQRVIAGWDFVNNDPDPMDDNGHGTHVAGIIGSSDATYRGIAPDVNLIALKVLNASGSGSFAAVESALQWVSANQARFNIVAVNMSLGAGNYQYNPYTFLEDDFQRLVNQGVFISVAAGNGFYSYSSQPGLSYPAVSPLVVSVGAVYDANFGSVGWSSGAADYTTAADRLASFSQRFGSLSLVAPGAILTSTYLGTSYASMAGTSMATPVVAGSAVLLHQALDATGQGGQANQSNIASIMRATGRRIVDGDDENDNVANTGMSFSRLDLFAAMNAVGIAPASFPYVDAFARADSPRIGAGWTVESGQFAVSGGKLVGAQGTLNVASLNGVSSANVTVSAFMDARDPGVYPGLIARHQGSGDSNMYLGSLVNRSGATFAEIWRNVGGTWTQLRSTAVSSAAGALRFDVNGDTLTLSFNGDVVASVVDNAITAPGTVGVRGAGGAYLNFFASPYASAVSNGSIPFSDDVNRADSNSLGNQWTQGLGWIRVASGTLVGAPGLLSTATINGVFARDVSVSAFVDASGAGTIYPGLTLRTSGPGDSNMYLGSLVNRGGSYAAEIWRNVNDVWTRLTSTPVSYSFGTLRFDAQGSTLSLFVNGQLVSTTVDTAITGAGRVGLRGSGGVYDNIAVQAVAAPVNASWPFNDAFQRANAPSLGALWSTQLGSIQVVNGQAVAAANDRTVAIVNGLIARDVDISAQVDATSGSVTFPGLVARYRGPADNNMYLGALVNRNGVFTAEIWKSVEGVWTQLASTVVSSGAGQLRFTVVGSSLSLSLDGQIRASVTDSSITSAGAVGIRGTGGSYDNFAAATLGAAPTNVSLPFSDSFTRADSPTIGDAWTIRQGQISLQGNRAVGVPSNVHVATLNSVSVADVSLVAQVDASAGSVSYPGLFARYRGVGDSDMYLGLLARRGTDLSAEIWRNVGGVWTRLAATPVGAASGTLRFDAQGSSLTLYFNGNLVASATDSALTLPGAVGIRGGYGAYSSFSATALNGGSSVASNTSSAAPSLVATASPSRATNPTGSESVTLAAFASTTVNVVMAPSAMLMSGSALGSSVTTNGVVTSRNERGASPVATPRSAASTMVKRTGASSKSAPTTLSASDVDLALEGYLADSAIA